MKNEHWIFSGVGLLVVMIAIGAFWLSFGSIRALAIQHNISSTNGWIFPAIVDGSIIVFSIVRLYAALIGEKRTAGASIVLIAIGVLLSIVFNISTTINSFHIVEWSSWVALVIHALPPLALLASFEIFMVLVHTYVRRNGNIHRYQELITRVNEAQNSLAQLHEQIKQSMVKLQKTDDEIDARLQKADDEYQKYRMNLQAEIEHLTAEISELQAAKKANAINEGQRLMLAYVSNHRDAPIAEIARVIGKAPSTVSGYVSQLQAAGLLHKNGDGWEV